MRFRTFSLLCLLAPGLSPGMPAAALPIRPALDAPARPGSVARATSVATAARAAKAKPAHLTLEQAVAQVQKQTHGKVLRAGQRQFGDMIEYRIKVLTPDGHVRVVPVRTRKPPASRTPSKETH